MDKHVRYNRSEKGKARTRRYNRSEAKRASSRRFREKLKSEGRCTRCGKTPAITESYCWDCLNEMEERSALT